MTFCLHYRLHDLEPTVETMWLYVEFLAESFKSAESIKNYVSGVRHMHNLLNIQSPSLESFELGLMLRAISLTMDPLPKYNELVTPALLYSLVTCCDSVPQIGFFLKCEFLFAFVWIFRQINLAPMPSNIFDHKETHLLW